MMSEAALRNDVHETPMHLEAGLLQLRAQVATIA